MLLRSEDVQADVTCGALERGMVAGLDGRQGLALLIRGADAGHELRRARPKVRDRGEAGVGLEVLPQARARQSGREDESRLGPGAISEIPYRDRKSVV